MDSGDLIDSIFRTILITGVIYGFIFNGVVFFSKRRKGKALIYLSLLVLFITLNNLQTWLIKTEITFNNPFLHYLRVPWYFFSGPMFYVFVVYYLKIQHKLKTFLVLTFGLFIGTIAVRLSLIYYAHYNLLSLDESDVLIDNYGKIEEILSFIYNIIFIGKAIIIFTRNQKLLEYIMNYDDLKWIKHFFFMAGSILIIWLIAITQNFGEEGFSDSDFNLALQLATSVLIYWIGIKGLFRYRILEDRIVLRENVNQERLTGSGIVKLNLKEESHNNINPVKSEKQLQLFNKIDSFVKDQKKYLDPYLNLDGLAEQLKMSSGHLSFLINNYGNYNFSDYINSLRVNQAKAFILEKEYLNYTIVSIGLESGFNSKSTFYTAFKKFTHLSPTQFKNKFAA